MQGVRSDFLPEQVPQTSQRGLLIFWSQTPKPPKGGFKFVVIEILADKKFAFLLVIFLVPES